MTDDNQQPDDQQSTQPVTLKGMLQATAFLFWLLVVDMLFYGVFMLVESAFPNCRINSSGDLVCVQGLVD